MRIGIRFLAVSLLSLGLGGCMATAGSAVEGRPVTAHSGFFSYAMLQPVAQGATINLGGKKVQVTVQQVTWNNGGALQLPASWSRLDLVESGDWIVVNVDGSAFAKIRPTT